MLGDCCISKMQGTKFHISITFCNMPYRTARLVIVPRALLKILFLGREGCGISIYRERDEREECTRGVKVVGFEDKVDDSRIGAMLCGSRLQRSFLVLFLNL
jgi:hypothetical protein